VLQLAVPVLPVPALPAVWGNYLMEKKLCIGTRGSNLALWQANFIKSEIERLLPDFCIDLSIIKTTGDRITDRPLALVGGKGLFVKEIENALLNKEIDLAVHSMKDMPNELPEGLAIGAVPERANPFDVLISGEGKLLSDYDKGAKVGTSSLRRSSQLLHFRSDLKLESIRGNLDTRLRKLDSGEYDAIVLAAAGLIRLQQEDRISEYLDEDIMVPAVGQGALCVESRKDDPRVESVLAALDHYNTRICVEGERAFLKRIGGSCHIPVACFGKMVDQEKILMTAAVGSVDGSQVIKEEIISEKDKVRDSGAKLAERILEKGGKKILEDLNSNDA
jgi:hydroxymethylbilane synthase